MGIKAYYILGTDGRARLAVPFGLLLTKPHCCITCKTAHNCGEKSLGSVAQWLHEHYRNYRPEAKRVKCFVTHDLAHLPSIKQIAHRLRHPVAQKPLPLNRVPSEPTPVVFNRSSFVNLLGEDFMPRFAIPPDVRIMPPIFSRVGSDAANRG